MGVRRARRPAHDLLTMGSTMGSTRGAHAGRLRGADAAREPHLANRVTSPNGRARQRGRHFRVARHL